VNVRGKCCVHRKQAGNELCLAVVTQMNGGVPEVVLKARGRAISRAVDVAEIVRNRFITDVDIGGIDISTEEIVSNEGSNTNVSTIEIQLCKL